MTILRYMSICNRYPAQHPVTWVTQKGGNMCTVILAVETWPAKINVKVLKSNFADSLSSSKRKTKMCSHVVKTPHFENNICEFHVVLEFLGDNDNRNTFLTSLTELVSCLWQEILHNHHLNVKSIPSPLFTTSKMSYHKISLNLKAAWLQFTNLNSFQNLMSSSAAVWMRCQSKYRVIGIPYTWILQLWYFPRSCCKTSMCLVNKTLAKSAVESISFLPAGMKFSNFPFTRLRVPGM